MADGVMLLLWKAGTDAYAVETRHVVEVVPRVPLRPVPHAPDSIPGVFLYRETLVPVVDATRLLCGRASSDWMSTRIILCHYEHPKGAARILGLLAEQVLDTALCAEGDLRAGTVRPPDAPYLGKVALREGQWVQLIDVEHLVPESLRGMLFAE